MSKPAITIACLTTCLAGFGAGFLARGRGPVVPEPSPNYEPVVMRIPSRGHVQLRTDLDSPFSVLITRAGEGNRELSSIELNTEGVHAALLFDIGSASVRQIIMTPSSLDGYDWGFHPDGKLEYATTWTYRKDASRRYGFRQFYDREGKPTHTKGLLEFVKTGPTVEVLGLPGKAR